MQFDVHRNIGRGAAQAPYLVDIQHDAVAPLRLRIVAPLLKASTVERLDILMPEVTVAGGAYIVSMPELFAIDHHRLGRVETNLAHHRDAIVRALDLLFTGF
ncbi:CcdB family protein [Pseudoxanthobacter sp. M-2]|uniref:CcdB family protein n=1 Tax=Pseudoxanthobacter sp. M-2 TaxID=3078754 RepID=UPI0038FD1894